MITIFQDDLAHLKLDLDQQVPLLHLQVKDWGVGVYKQLLDRWVIILEKLRELGLPAVFSFIDKQDTNAQKFQGMFGLELVGENEQGFLYKLEL